MLALYRCGRQAEALEAYRPGGGACTTSSGSSRRPSCGRSSSRSCATIRRSARRRRVDRPRPLRRRGRAPLAAARRSLRVAGAAVARVSAAARRRRGARGREHAVLVDRRGSSRTEITVGASPAHAIRAAGFLWTSNERDGTVSRVDIPQRTVETIPVGRKPEGLAFADGHVWVADGGDATVVGDRSARGQGRAHASGSETGRSAWRHAGRTLWVADSVDGTLARSTRAPVACHTVAGRPQPTAVAASRDGVWVALAGSGAVVELDATGAASSRRSTSATTRRRSPSTAATSGSRTRRTERCRASTRRAAQWTPSCDSAARRGRSRRRRARLGGARGRTARAVDAQLGAAARATSRSAASRQQSSRTERAPGCRRSTAPRATAAARCASATARALLVRLLRPARLSRRCVWQLARSRLRRPRRLPPRRRPGRRRLVPDLAQAVPRPSEDGRTYVFRLRPGVRFSNGRLVRPSDVRASFERLFRSITSDARPRSTQSSAPARASRAAGATSPAASSPTTAPARSRSTSRAGPGLPLQARAPDGVRRPAGQPADDRAPAAARHRAPIASTAVAARARLVLRPQPALPASSRRTRRPTDSRTASSRPPTSRRGADRPRSSRTRPTSPPRSSTSRRSVVDALATRYASQLHADPLGETEYIFLNTRVPPFDRLAARRAVNEAVDRGRLVQLLGGRPPRHRPARSCRPTSPATARTAPTACGPRRPGRRPPRTSSGRAALVAAFGTRGARVHVWAPADHAAVAATSRGPAAPARLPRPAHIVAGRHSRYYEPIGEPEDTRADRLVGLDPRLHLRRRLHPAALHLQWHLARRSHRDDQLLAVLRRRARPAGPAADGLQQHDPVAGSGGLGGSRPGDRRPRRRRPIRERPRSSPSSPRAPATTSSTRNGACCSTSSGCADR